MACTTAPSPKGRLALSLLALLAAARPTLAAEAEHGPGCTALVGTVSRELAERPIGALAGIGALHQEVTTAAPLAQALYDQGFVLLASYEWVDAARSFHAALRLDPNLAMAHLGLAKAYLGTDALPEAAEHLRRAEELAANGGVSEKEALWIGLGAEQLSALQAPESEQAERLAAYRASIDALVALDPADANAWVLRGTAEEPGAWGRGQAGGIGSIAFYETALRRAPDHLAAHHFLTHSYENVGRHRVAAEHARRYAALAPNVPHAQHMLGHVLPRLGEWKEARRQFVRADELEKARLARERMAGEDDWHHGHNLHLLGIVSLRLGDEAEAERFLRQAFELQERGRVAGIYAGPYVEYLLLRGRNDEALAAARQIEPHSPVGAIIGAALAGEALIGLGRLDAAAAELARAESLSAKAAAELAGTPYVRFLPLVEAQYPSTLRGRLQLRGEDPVAGEAVLLAMADDVGRNPRLDAWASGMLRVDRAIADADALGRADLARQLRERTRGLGSP